MPIFSPSNTKSASYILMACLFVILFCATTASFMYPMRLRETFAQTSSPPFQSPRKSLIDNFIRNLYFYNTYSRTPSTIANDINNLYSDVATKVSWDPESSFDKLCYVVKVDEETKGGQQIAERIRQNCSIYYLDRFAMYETTLFPTFDALKHTEAVVATTYPDNFVYNVDAHSYQLTKAFFTPEYVRYSYDANSDLLRIFFSDAQGKSIKPTYLVLANPFAIEYENVGTFKVMLDVNPQMNLMSYYHTADDAMANRAIFLSNAPLRDDNNNRINIMPMGSSNATLSLEPMVAKLNTTYTNQQMKIFYSKLDRIGIPVGNIHVMTLAFDQNTNNSATFSFTYQGNKTNVVTRIQGAFQNKSLSITIDDTSYSALLREANSIFSNTSTTSFNAFLVMAFNVITIVVMYKRSDNTHHVLLKRSYLVNTSGTVHPRVFKFPVLTPQTEANASQYGFKQFTYIPDMLTTAHQLGYSFSA